MIGRRRLEKHKKLQGGNLSYTFFSALIISTIVKNMTILINL